MPSPPKYIENGGLYLVTSRTEEGLPFLDEVKWKPIFEAIMARAAVLFPVEVVAYCLMANHFHLILVPINPEQFPAFVGYVKQELSHIVNRLKGRRKKTIWCEGYDSPILLGYHEAIHYLTYCYTQPQTIHKVARIEDYKGASSWQQFISCKYTSTHKRLHRTNFRHHNKRERLSTQQEDCDNQEEHTLTLNPFVFIKNLAPNKSADDVKSEIIKEVRRIEDNCANERKEKNIKLNNHQRLSDPDTYVPSKFGRRMLFICWNKELNKRFLYWIKDSIAECKAVLARWRLGEISIPWPPGFFAPRLPWLASLVPSP